MKNRFATALATLLIFICAFSARAQFDIYGTTTAVALATNNIVSATVTNVGADVHGYVGQPVILLCYTNSGGDNPTLGVRLQTSASLATGYTDIPGASFTQITNAAAGAAGIVTIGISPGAVSKYVRAVQTVGGTNPVFQTSITLIGRLKYN